MTQDQIEEFEERAAIMQYMGGQTKAQAERNARLIINAKYMAKTRQDALQRNEQRKAR